MTDTILQGNNLDILPTLPDNSVDSIVTDPPYELGFIGIEMTEDYLPIIDARLKHAEAEFAKGQVDEKLF